MAEKKNEKKSVNSKTTVSKKTTTKTTPKKKPQNNTTSKNTYNKNVKSTKNSSPKKSNVKKSNNTQTKKVVKKSTTQKKAPEKKVTKLTEEQLLEKTLIFDGRQNQNLVEVVEKLEEKNVVLEDKVIKRSNVRKVIIAILTILIFVIIAVTTIYVVKTEADKVTAQADNVPTLNSNIYKKVVDNYETIGSINKNDKDKDDSNSVSIEDIQYDNIETLTLAQFEEKILNKEDMTVLISSTTCAACVTFEPTISEVYKSLDKTIYRINITAMSEEEVNRFRTYYKFTVTPTIFMIKDGYVKAETTGQMFADELTTWVNQNS